MIKSSTFIPGSDTAKQDLILLIAGVVSFAIFFWLYSDFHPLSEANTDLGSETSAEISSELASDFGFIFTDGPVSFFRSNNTLLDSLQRAENFKEFYSNPLHRSVFPVYYWDNKFKMEDAEQEGAIGLFEAPANLIRIQLDENGRFISLQNPHNFLPVNQLNSEALAYAFELDELAIPEPGDTTLANRFEFRFQGPPERNVNLPQFQGGGSQFISRSVAGRIAEYYLTQSAWPESHFEITGTEIVPLDGKNAARVTLEHQGGFSSQTAEVSVTIMPAGSLIAMNYSFPKVNNSESRFNQIKSGLRGVIILLAIFWLIILLFIRFRMRLIDMTAATLVAVIAGLIFPLIIFLEQLYSHINGFGSLSFGFILSMLISMGFFAAMTSLGFFAVTAVSDSITRQNWEQKLRTIDQFRVGYFFTIPVGLNIIRGISYGFITALAWCIILIALPGSYISVESTVFSADSRYLPYLAEILGNFAIYLLVAEIVFLILMGVLRSSTRFSLWFVVIPAIIFGLMDPLPFEVGGFSAELITASAAGLIAGWVYLKEDFLTTFITLFVFVTTISTAPGWLVDNSPDSMSFILFLMILCVGYVIGAYNIYKGKNLKELPDFVPEYVLELAQEDRIKQELQIARKVQQSFLPVRTPDIPGLDIAAICTPAYETGGDYYDLITLEDGRLAVTIGDVSGKGIQAAFYMTFIKGVLHSLCNDYTTTKEVLTKTNKLFRRNANRGTFISLIFGVVNAEENTFLFSRAGHNPLLFFESKTKKLHEFKPEGLAVGMADTEIFEKYIGEQRVSFNQDDMLIFFTDGVVEAISKTNKVYGDSRLHNLIRQYHKLPANELITKLEKDLRQFSENTQQHDDLTMIVIKKK